MGKSLQEMYRKVDSIVTKDRLFTVVENECIKSGYLYDYNLSLHRNIAAARRQMKFIVVGFLAHVERIEARL